MEDNTIEKHYILTRLRHAAHCWRHGMTTSNEFLPTPELLDEAAAEIERFCDQSIEVPLDELPGMLALQIAVKNGSFPHTMDARVWAQEWLKTIQEHPEIPTDEASMIGWFANSIMAGYDNAMVIQKETNHAPL
jgi:hypothetical protein